MARSVINIQTIAGLVIKSDSEWHFIFVVVERNINAKR